jgi:hypothetical protein
MKTIKVEFHVGTDRLGSTWSEIVEIEVGEDATEQEIEDEINDYFKDWIWENIDSGFKIIEQ